MYKVLRIIIIILIFSASNIWGDTVNIYQKNSDVQVQTKLDKLLSDSYNKNNLELPYECSETTFLRRAYLTFAGRIPTVSEVKSYLKDKSKNKSDKLIDKLVDSEDFNLYWTMHFLDFLRVKSEFPINLWPNAVYAYSKRINDFLKNNESYGNFAKSLLLSSGSNFRNPEVNFYRALNKKNPEGVSEVVALTFMGVYFNDLPKLTQNSLLAFFDNVKYKSTKEWKEEIVYFPLSREKINITLPNGEEVTVPENSDARKIFVDYLVSEDNPYFSRAIVNRVWLHIFGDNFSQDKNNLLSDLHSEEILDYLAKDFSENGYQIKYLCKKIGKSIAFRSSPFAKSNQVKSEKFFNAYKIQRIDAEIIDDNINKITHSATNYASVIPEPFTNLDNSQRTISIADGSITSSFLIIFGRSVRDSGKSDDRNNSINAKQRQQMFNSTDIYKKISKFSWGKFYKKMSIDEKINFLYLNILSRYPAESERKLMNAYLKKSWKNLLNSIWILFNTQEFLYKF